MKKHFLQLAAALFALTISFHALDLGNLFVIPNLANLYPSESPAQTAPAKSIDLTKLPLGDGKLSTSPKVGWIWPCRVNPNGRGASQEGPWIKEDGTYDFTAKSIVQGKVNWPKRFKMSLKGDKRIFSTNDLPNHPTGKFPITEAENPDAYQYDDNPNRISAQNMYVELPANPTLAAEPTCTPGAIGILETGSVLFNALDSPGRDALAHEVQDSCQGHPEPSGIYHYHSITTCLPEKKTRNGHSALVGYSLDGFGIYGRYGTGGKNLLSADLDVCHGHTHKIEWNGKKVSMYHYHGTWDFPYTIGCMRGTYKMSDVRAIRGTPRRRPQRSPQTEDRPLQRIQSFLGGMLSS
jgi:hypothetical protein